MSIFNATPLHGRAPPPVSTDPAGIFLRVNGKEYSGWKTARVTRGIEAIAGSFELSVSDRWVGQDKPWPIFENDECVVMIGSTPVITGFVDKRAIAYGADNHSLTLTGRDRTGDLVDCHPFLTKWEFKGISVLNFVKQVAEAFQISVSLQPGLSDSVLPKAPKKLSVDPGDTAFAAIENACRLAALLPVSDGNGGLMLTRAGTERCKTSLTQGENILSASADFDMTGRFRHYYVLGQHRGSDDFFGESAAAVQGSAEDKNARATRTCVIRPEGNCTAEHAKIRAQWEAIHRAARGDSVSATVQGWQQSNGELWPINKLVGVHSPALGIDGDMLISQVTYNVALERGTTTQFNLRRPDAFKTQPVIGAESGLWKEIARGV